MRTAKTLFGLALTTLIGIAGCGGVVMEIGGLF